MNFTNTISQAHFLNAVQFQCVALSSEPRRVQGLHWNDVEFFQTYCLGSLLDFTLHCILVLQGLQNKDVRK